MIVGLVVLGGAQARAGTHSAEPALEQAFDSGIDVQEQSRWLRQLSSAPNHVGSPHDRANAERVLGLLRSWGWTARMETFSVLYPTPLRTTLEMIAPERVVLGGQEQPVPGDDSTTDLSQALPPYFAFQSDGDVTGALIYVNYGMPADYAELERRDIDVRGKVVIARYGGGWRGLKVKLAQEHGAIGCVVYSDPAEDGFARGDTYPTGGWRPPEGVQRGSVADTSLYPGDPLTPGLASTPGAIRLTRETAPTIMKIPALPISYADASKLLQRLAGPPTPTAWRGALPFTYHFGSADGVRVHLAVVSDWSQKTLYDVIGEIRGSTAPDQWVVRGNHRDAWVFGASDPLAGQTALLGEAKAIGGLLKSGWRPARTILYASWDGEEPGLVGSTEWVEAHLSELRSKAVLYVNTDSMGRGFLSYAGSPELTHFLNDVAADIPDPEVPASLLARQRAHLLVQRFEGEPVGRGLEGAARQGGDLPIGALGAGSDFVAFLEHAGVPTVDIGFSGEDSKRGSYHSAYDTYQHYVKFVDPGLLYVNTLSRVVGRIVLRYAGAPTLPARFADLAVEIKTCAGEVEDLLKDQQSSDTALDRLLESGMFRVAADPTQVRTAPQRPRPAEAVDLSDLDAAADELLTAAQAYDRAADLSTRLEDSQVKRLNELLSNIDQLLLSEAGLPGRPWYRNLLFAPGWLTGYDAKTLPGIREAVEERHYDVARTNTAIAATAVRAYAIRLREATSVLVPARPGKPNR
jgi:N-acetylated-alpha-linked acidic dipeptidase